MSLAGEKITPETIRLTSVAKQPCESADTPHGICLNCQRRWLAEKPTALVMYCPNRNVVALPDASKPFGSSLQILDQESFDRCKVRGMQ